MAAKFAYTTALLGCALIPSAFANDDVLKQTGNAKQWAMQAGNMQNQRYSGLKQITKDNVKNLRVAWTFSTGVLRGHEGGPLVIGDMLYIHSPFPNKVFADRARGPADQVEVRAQAGSDGDPGDVLRHREPRPRLRRGQDLPAAGRHHAGRARREDRQGAVEGQERRSEERRDQHQRAAHLQEQGVHRISGGEFGVRGFVAAYDINTGKLAWKGYSTGPDNEMLIDPGKTMTWTDGKMAPVGADSSLKSWQGDQWKIGGGTTWGWYSYDPKLNLMYYGSGNPSTWNPVQRPGDNKWSMTIWARDVDSGQVKWVYQMTPHDEWDFDGVNEMILADGVNVKGKPRNVLVHFDRNGFGYTLDRRYGRIAGRREV
jgi:glucose dehydrogenase